MLNIYQKAALFCDGVLDRRAGRVSDAPRGLLIIGQQGVGKTIMASAINEILDNKPMIIFHSWKESEMISAMRQFDTLTYDGLPRVTGSMSEVITRAIALGNINHRALYTDEEVVIDTSKTHFIITALFNHLPDVLTRRMITIEIPESFHSTPSGFHEKELMMEGIRFYMKNKPKEKNETHTQH
jgi:ATP-dependent protease Clp ATPase subunit